LTFDHQCLARWRHTPWSRLTPPRPTCPFSVDGERDALRAAGCAARSVDLDPGLATSRRSGRQPRPGPWILAA
jgi:hypothetical protein